MKVLIVGLTLITIIILMIVFQSDNYNYRLQSEFLKYCANEAANSASLFFYEYEYKNGLKIFDEIEGIISIENIIKLYLKTDNNLLPGQMSYWTDKINYTAYFFSDNFICNVYKNGVKEKSFSFIYPYLYTDRDMNYKKSVGNATVIVTINAGKPRYRQSFLKAKPCIRSSGYEYSN